MNQVTQRSVPTYMFNSNNNVTGNNFRARPLKQWRRQLSLSSQNGIITTRSMSNSSVGMPMDRPNGTLAPITCANNSSAAACSNVILLKEDIIKNPSDCMVPITHISNTSYTDNTAYMQSRCVTYDQKMAYNPAPFINYFSTAGIPIEPSSNTNGTQVRETNNCYTPLYTNGIKSNNKCNTTIYKPNNSQFAQQGGVSSGSRISRLKYNTLNSYGAAYNSASGAVNINTGYYQIQPSPSYYNKLKPQKVVYPYTVGTKSYCKEEYSEC